MSMLYPQINNGKKPDEILHATHLFLLPPKTPYGNLQAKILLIVTRLDYVNLKIPDVYRTHTYICAQKMFSALVLYQHLALMEEVVYWLRVTADDIVRLAYVLSTYLDHAHWPERLCIDSIGSLLNHLDDGQSRHCCDLFRRYSDYLALLNDVSNAYKHSVVNSDSSPFGENEPVVNALHFPRNNTKKGLEFHSVEFGKLVTGFDSFYGGVMPRIKAWGREVCDSSS